MSLKKKGAYFWKERENVVAAVERRGRQRGERKLGGNRLSLPQREKDLSGSSRKRGAVILWGDYVQQPGKKKGRASASHPILDH